MSARKWLLLFAVVAGLIAVAAMSFVPSKPSLLLLDWANKARADKPPTAILIEMGLKDETPTVWSSRATVTGAKVVGREGYRFWADDKLKEPDAWEASSHHAVAAPKGQPAVIRQEGIATVGVVLHLADVAADAVLTIDPPDKEKAKVEVPLKDVLAGKTVPLWDGAAEVRLMTTAVPLAEDKTEDDFPAAAYGPDGTLWVAYIAYKDRNENRRIEAANLKEQPDNFKALYTPEYADQLFVKYYREGKWSDPIAMTEGNEDLMRCAIAVRGDGVAWVMYSAHRKGRFDIYARALTPNFAAGGKDAVKVNVEQQWTTADNSAANLSPVACTKQDGNVWVSFQQWSADGAARVVQMSGLDRKADDKDDIPKGWITFSTGDGVNCWHPVIAAGPADRLATPFDSYIGGDYDVTVKTSSGKGIDTVEIAYSPHFEARPSPATTPRAASGSPTKKAPKSGARTSAPSPTTATRSTSPARPGRLPGGRQADAAGRRTAASPPTRRRPDRGKPVHYEKVPRLRLPGNSASTARAGSG